MFNFRILLSIVAAYMLSAAMTSAEGRDGQSLLRLVNRGSEHKADYELSLSEPSTGIIKGIVVDENGSPLPYPQIRVRGKRIAVLGDSVGRFYLSMKGVAKKDTISISYLGYKAESILAGELSDGRGKRIQMSPSAAVLQEVIVTPDGRATRRKEGKKHGWGLMKGYLGGATAGEAWGFEFHAKKDRRLVLDKVGFFYCEGDSQMTSMKFRVNVYDMSAVEGSMSDKFVNILSAPIYFDYTLGENRSGKIEYILPSPVVLPADAMVEIEFLENLGSEKLYYKCNLVGKQSWGRYADDIYWYKHPFASPFYAECLEIVPE